MAKADIAFWIFCAFILGIASASLDLPFPAVLIGAAGLLVLRGPRKPIQFFFILSGFSAGVFYFHLFNVMHAASSDPPLPGETAVALVVSEPHPTPKAQSFDASFEPPYAGKMRVVTDAFRDIRYGDRIDIKGELEDKPPYPPAFMFPKISVIGRRAGNPLQHALLDVKSAFLGQLHRFLPTDSAALMAGLLAGETKDFSANFKEAMRASGTTHLTALSGYNIMLVVSAVSGLLSFLARRIRVIATVIFITLFVLMVGAQASVVRAAIMGALLLLAQETGRPYVFRTSAAATAVLMLLADPHLLVFDLGFQLSFASLLGITFLRPALASLLRLDTQKDPGTLGWKEHILTTTSAQLMVIPIILSAFQEFSLSGIIANVLILEFVPLAMLSGFLLGSSGLFLGSLAFAIAPAAHVLAQYIRIMIAIFAKARLPVALYMDPFIFSVYYAIIALVVISIPKLRHAA